VAAAKYRVEANDGKPELSELRLCRGGFKQDNSLLCFLHIFLLLQVMNISGVVASSKDNLPALDVAVVKVEHLPHLAVSVLFSSAYIDKIKFSSTPAEAFGKL
jgi:hypothetical protein